MELEAPVLQQCFKGHTGPITSLSFNPTGKTLASSSDDNSFLVWNLSSNKASLRYKAKPCPVSYVSYSPQGTHIASAQGEFVRIWLSSIQGKSTEYRAHLGTVRSVEFSPDSEQLLTASNDKSVKLWVASRRRFLSSFTGHTNWVKLARFSPDGDMILSCSDDRTTRLWDPNTSKCIHTFTEIKGSVRYSDFHPTSTCIGVAMSHNVAKLYDLRMMKLLQYYACHNAQVNSLAFHPSGCFMITGSDDNTSKVIDLFEGHVVFTLESHSKAVTAVKFSKSGEYFATASDDKTVFVWKSNFDHNIINAAKNKSKCLRESVANNYDPNKPKIQVKGSSLQSNNTEIKEIYTPRDYEEMLERNILSDKENEMSASLTQNKHNDSLIECTSPLPGTRSEQRRAARRNVASIGSEELQVHVLKEENEKLKAEIAALQSKVAHLELSEESIKKKLYLMEERLSAMEEKRTNDDYV